MCLTVNRVSLIIRQGMLIKTISHWDYMLQLPDDKRNNLFYLYYCGLRKSDCSTSSSLLLYASPSKLILLYNYTLFMLTLHVLTIPL